MEIYLVYETYLNNLEYAKTFYNLENAKIDCLERMIEAVNKDAFNKYLDLNNIQKEDINIELINDYFISVEDDSFVDIKKIILE